MRQLAGAIRDPRELCRRLGLDATLIPGAEAGHSLFEVRVPEAFAARMRQADPDDPLLRQVLPLDAEQTSPEGYVTDPLQEAQHTARRGLIHKYAGRVLLITSPACAINCRYCFRRHFPYQENAPSRSQWDDTLDYLREDATLREAMVTVAEEIGRHVQGLDVRLEERDDQTYYHFTYRVPGRSAPSRQHNDNTLMGAYNILTFLYGEPIKLRAVYLCGEEPRDLEPYTQQLHSALRFNHPENTLVFDRFKELSI